MRLETWYHGRLTDAELAEAIGCGKRAVQVLLNTPAFQDAVIGGGRGSWKNRRVPSRVRVGLAAAYALHRHAGLTLEQASQLIGASWEVCKSIAKTLDLVPPGASTIVAECEDVIPACVVEGREYDPLSWMADWDWMESTEPQVDEYIEVVDGRIVFWVRPKLDAFDRLVEISQLIALRKASQADAAQVKSERKLLKSLRGDGERQSRQIGGIRDGQYMVVDPVIARHVGVGLEAAGFDWSPEDIQSLDSNFRSKTAVNISLPCRSMKRRALGLEAIDMFAEPERAKELLRKPIGPSNG